MKIFFPIRKTLLISRHYRTGIPLKKVNFLSNNGLFTKNELTENQSKVNTVFDELIAQNTGNSKLYFMHQKLSESCDFNQCKDKLEQLQEPGEIWYRRRL